MASQSNVYRPKMTGILIAAILLVMVVLLVLISTILILFAGGSTPDATTAPQQGDVTPAWTTPAPITTTAVTTAHEDPPAVIPGMNTIQVDTSKTNLGPLVLADELHLFRREGLVAYSELTAAKAEALGFAVLSSSSHYSLRHASLYLDKTAKAAFEQMAEALSGAVGSNLQVRNAYYYKADLTAVTNQDELEAVEHSTGLVLDLQVSVDGKIYAPTFPSQKAYINWLTENSWKYGYIWVRDTTNYSTFRYVGIPHAAALQKMSISLSDYLTQVTGYTFQNNLKVYDANGNEWWIYYVKATTAMVEITVVGNESNYLISGDNNGGFVVAIDTAVFAQ